MGMVHGVCAYIIVVVHPLIQGSMWVWYMVYYSCCTPNYIGVYVGVLHGVCASITMVVHPLILGQSGYGTWCMCLYNSGNTPTYTGSKWVWYMVYVPIL